NRRAAISVRHSISVDAVPRPAAPAVGGGQGPREALTGGFMHRSIKRPALSRCGQSFVAAAALWVTAAQAVVPTPTVTGPIPGETPGSPSRNYTYWATDIVLKNFGFVEEEFFFEGTANRYDAVAPSGAVGNANRCSPIANI